MNLLKTAVIFITVAGLVPFEDLVAHAALAEAAIDAPGTGSRSARPTKISPYDLTRAHFDRELLGHLRAVQPFLETPERAVDIVLQRVEGADSNFTSAMAAQTLAYGLMYKPGRKSPRSFHPAWDFALNSSPEAQPRYLEARPLYESGAALEAFTRLIQTTSKITQMHVSRMRLILDALYLGETDVAHAGNASPTLSGNGTPDASPSLDSADVRRNLVDQFYAQANAVSPRNSHYSNFSIAFERRTKAGRLARYTVEPAEFHEGDPILQVARRSAHTLATSNDALVAQLIRGILLDFDKYSSVWDQLRSPEYAGEGTEFLGRLEQLGKFKRFAFNLAHSHRRWYRALAANFGKVIGPFPLDASSLLREWSALFPR